MRGKLNIKRNKNAHILLQKLTSSGRLFFDVFYLKYKRFSKQKNELNRSKSITQSEQLSTSKHTLGEECSAHDTVAAEGGTSPQRITESTEWVFTDIYHEGEGWFCSVLESINANTSHNHQHVPPDTILGLLFWTQNHKKTRIQLNRI